jgi:hypothetical protein
MICPPTKYIYCYDDIDNLSLTGIPTLFNNHAGVTPKYIDQKNINACNVGHVIRRWYIDYNNNDQPDQNETTCYQDIYVQDISWASVSITYPKDITVACRADVPDSAPQITNGPCDLIGVNTKDEEFIIEGSNEEGCRKIVRTFTIISWCNPNLKWTGKQIIKVVDKEKPQFIECKDITIGFNQDCKSKVTLTNKAIDNGNCSSTKLKWTVDIDLYADGVVDLSYGNHLSNEFFIPLKNNGEELKITLPGTYGNGLHKVYWKVKDSCGNLSSCTSTFVTKDTKSPVPYCYNNLSVGVYDTKGITVKASQFCSGAIDNCTAPEYIRASFSENVNDTIRQFSCDDLGFKEVKVYFTDLAGNKDFCKVSLTIFDNDNGECKKNIILGGKISQLSGRKVMSGDINLSALDNQFNLFESINDGFYKFLTPVFMEHRIIPKKIGLEDATIDMVDYVVMRDYLMSIDTLSMLAKFVADINEDLRANSQDMVFLKSVVKQGLTTYGKGNDWHFIPSYINFENEFIKLKKLLYKPGYESINFNGNFDFTAIAKGDVSEAMGILEARNPLKVQFEIGEELSLNGDLVYPIISSQNINSQGFVLDINRNINELILEDFESVNSDVETKLLSFQNNKIEKGQPLLFIKKDFNPIKLSGYFVEDKVKKTIEIQEKEYALEVFPTLVSNEVNISAPINREVFITNSLGKRVLTYNMKSNLDKIDVSNLSNGLYFVNSSFSKGKIIKFVKL